MRKIVLISFSIIGLVILYWYSLSIIKKESVSYVEDIKGQLKKEFYDKLNENEIKFQEQLSIQFGKISNNIFAENTDNAEKKNLPIENAKIDRFENKKTIFTKLLDFIKGLRKRS